MSDFLATKKFSPSASPPSSRPSRPSCGSDLTSLSGDCGPGGNSFPTEKSALGDAGETLLTSGVVFVVVKVTADDDDEDDEVIVTGVVFFGVDAEDEVDARVLVVVVVVVVFGAAPALPFDPALGPQTRLFKDLMKSAGVPTAFFPDVGNAQERRCGC